MPWHNNVHHSFYFLSIVHFVMNYMIAGLFALALIAAWYMFGLFINRSRLSMHLAQLRYNRRTELLNDDNSAFGDAYRAGLHSRNFDISINVEDGDSRPGLDAEEVRQIMESEGVSFDKARLIRQQQLMRSHGIDPSTGMPLDSKAVTFSR